MEHKYLKGRRGLSRMFLILPMLFSVSCLYAQAPVNFSGKWKFDVSKSNPGEGGSFLSKDIIHVITQDPSSISVEETILKEGSGNVSSTETFSLDGKEVILKKDYGITKKTAQWTDDKKGLILTTIITVGTKDYRSDALYRLSDDGLQLTVETSFKNPVDDSRIVQVYNKL